MTGVPDRFSDVHLTLCLAHDCNLRCRYCYGGANTLLPVAQNVE